MSAEEAPVVNVDDLAYEPHEVCTYPDTGKVFVRSLRQVGRLEKMGTMDGEPERPKVFDLREAEPPRGEESARLLL